jgi:hypothetical protein
MALTVTSHHASAMEKTDYVEAGAGGGYYDYPSAQMLRRSLLGQAMVRSPFAIYALRL